MAYVLLFFCQKINLLDLLDLRENPLSKDIQG